ncbi:MAG: ATP-binding protein [Xenococcus sp. (in: cyanobacteria)]
MSNSYFSDIGGDFQGFYGKNLGIVNQYIITQKSKAEIHSRDLIKASPYPGLRKFQIKDKDKFFGRDQWIIDLSNHLNKDNVLLLLGPSGNGKSSLIRAGLIPKLEDTWGSFINLTFEPDVNPFESLYACLVSQTQYSQSEAKIARTVKEDTLVQLVTSLKQDSRWLIFIDQFEEVFTKTQKQECDKFVASLDRLIREQDSTIKIVLTMRTDFYDRLSSYPSLGIVHDRYCRMLTDMTESELKLAIAEPAARNGVTFENDLVKKIISNCDQQAGFLPLLQYTLYLLWNTDKPSQDNRVLNKETYEQIGGVSGALQQYFDEIYQNLSPEQQLTTKQIFLKLVDIIDFRTAKVLRTPMTRKAYKSEFNKAQIEIVDLLVNKSLLVSDDRDNHREGQPTVEIAHDALLRSWSELKNWIADARHIIPLNNHLEEDANRWQELKRINQERTNEELWRGSNLEKVSEFREDGTFEVVLGGLSEIAKEFIDASIDWRKQKNREELVAAQKLRVRSLVAIFGLTVAVIALAAGFFAFSSLIKSKEEQLRVRAESIKNKLSTSNQIDYLLESIGLVDENLKFNQRWFWLQPKKWFKLENKLVPEVQSILYQAVEDCRERYIFKGHQDWVNSVVFSPNGQFIVSGSRDKTVKLWDRSNPTPPLTFDEHQSWVNSVAFSPDGQFIVSGSSDHTVKLWDVENKVLLHPSILTKNLLIQWLLVLMVNLLSVAVETRQ